MITGKKRFLTTDQIVRGKRAPIDISVIPNFMGINLVAVKGVSWIEQVDGQLVSLTFHFTPKVKTAKAKGTRGSQRRAASKRPPRS
jgi:hypothetical protein